ncbi:MAG TPA: hypothetical protein VEG32_08170 [Clostridia bacterium]|nr:hypothetical protein [Clostridia bacterium]
MTSGYAILTNRKRAIIALVHSVAFLLIAVRGLTVAVLPLQWSSPISAKVMAAIYLIVTSILVWLAAISGTARERLYFGLCSASAGFGLLRQIAGDPTMHFAVHVRIAALLAAVVVGILILREYSVPVPVPMIDET